MSYPRLWSNMSEDTATAASAMSTTSNEENQTSKRELPKLTTGTSEEYIDNMSWALAYAMLPNPVWRLIMMPEDTNEKGGDVPEEKLLAAYHAGVKDFLTPGIKSGAFIAEAGDFAAYAAWWPPGAHEEPKTSSDPIDASQLNGKAARAALERKVDQIKIELIWSKYGQEFWSLGLLGRDPRKPAVPGAVRAVLQPTIEQAAADGKPIWLATTSAHARDIYMHLGWQLVRTVEVGGHCEWCMILYPPSPESGR